MNRPITLTAALAGVLSLGALALTAEDGRSQDLQDTPQARQQQQVPQAIQNVIRDWPQGPRKTAEKMIEKYGPPSGLTRSRMIWENPPQPWNEIILYRRTLDHNFPVPHQDYLEHVVQYEVPENKFNDLANYDGSIIAERTRGALAARCHTEWANILALNLAHGVIEGEMSVEEARQAYADAARKKMQGQTPPITQRLTFEPMAAEEARDPGEQLIEPRASR